MGENRLIYKSLNNKKLIFRARVYLKLDIYSGRFMIFNFCPLEKICQFTNLFKIFDIIQSIKGLKKLSKHIGFSD